MKTTFRIGPRGRIQFTRGRGINHGHLIFWPYRVMGQIKIRFGGTRWFGIYWENL